MKEKVRRRLIKQLQKDPSSVNAVIRKYPELQHITVEDVILEEEIGPEDKIVPVGKNRVIPVKRFQYSQEMVDAVYHTLAHIAGARDAQFKLRGTEFYSAEMERLFDKMCSTKLMPIFKQNNAGIISDQVFDLTKKFSDTCDYNRQLAQQPQIVQDRFERKYRDLLIEAGITIKS